MGGALTDLQSNDIIREVIAPLLKQDRLVTAIDRGSVAIAQALVKGTPPGERPRPGVRPAPSLLSVGVVAGGIVLVIVLSIFSPAFRSILWAILQVFFLFGGRGGGGGRDSDSGYTGGGGRSGGGGSSDDY